MTEARLDPWVVPPRHVPKNVIVKSKWRLSNEDELTRKVSHRVTTDDSIDAVDGEHISLSRNHEIDPDGWGGAKLKGPRTLSEALAIVKSAAKQMGIVASQAALERIALWAVDLAHAYRELAVARQDWWQQCFIWVGGSKLDLRCVFGAAHMVDFFQRVSTFVLSVAAHRIHEYDKQHPYSRARQAWQQWRQEHLGGEQSASFEFIYLDDGSGFVPLGEGEQLRGAPAGMENHTQAALFVEPARDGETPQVKLKLFVNKSRPQIHLLIIRWTFEEAGWDISDDKVQLDFSLDLLGLGVSSSGAGCQFVQEAKRRGMLLEIDEQLQSSDGTVTRASSDELTGRLSFTAQAACEGNAYLQPMYRFKNAKWAISVKPRGDEKQAGKRVVRPPRLCISGSSKTQQLYRAALRWWRETLAAGVSVPLSPRVHFPELTSPGCAFMFTDAAREDGTGFGAYSMATIDGELTFLFHEERWQPHVLRALQANAFSMPAGECHGAVVFADALLNALGNVTHLVVFTDSDATAKGLLHAGSGAPQLNVQITWLQERHPGVQFLGVHQPGVRNTAADALSRSAEGREWVLADAAAAGAVLRELPLSPDAPGLLADAMACPLRD